MAAIGIRPVPAAPPGDLQRLLDTERRLTARLDAARSERDRLIAEAEAAAAAAEHALAEQIAQEERLLAERLEREAAAGEREIAARADAERARWRGIADGRLAVVARELAQRFVAEPPT